MRRFSQKFILVNGEKYYLVSVKEEYIGWDPVAFFKKSEEKDEFGFMVEGDSLQCPHPGEVSRMSWISIDSWIQVHLVCKKCWGAHRQPDGRYDCVLRSKNIKQYRDGHPCR